LESHALEGANRLPELKASVSIRDCDIKCTLGEAEHLGGNTYAAFVQNFDGDLQ
jgi:hypothetical protein